MNIFNRLVSIDRRIIFLLIFIGVSIPMFFVIGFFVEITENVRGVYELIEAQPKGTPIIISFDYDPASKPELQPMANAVIEHAFQKNLKVIGVALWPMGVQMCNEAFETITPIFPKKEYGKDYANLGYKAGGIVVINHLAKDLRGTFPQDAGGTPIEELPILNRIDNLEKIGFVLSLSAGAPGIKEWVQVVHDAFGRPVVGGTTAVQAPMILPYVNEQQQLAGLLGGLKGAAEYESLLNQPGFATKGMDAQSIAHLIIVLLIIIGNISYFATRKKEKRTPVR
jgi:hypothetical protein